MKAYRVPTAAPGERWQRTQDEAKALARKLDPNIVTRGAVGWHLQEVPTDSRGLVAFLNQQEDAAQALGEIRQITAPPPAAEPPPPAPYVARSLQLDEEFDALPLARQLDLAARAMENARLCL